MFMTNNMQAVKTPEQQIKKTDSNSEAVSTPAEIKKMISHV